MTATEIRKRQRNITQPTATEIIKLTENSILDAVNAGEYVVNPAIKNKIHLEDVHNHFVDRGFVVNKRYVGSYWRLTIGWREEL